MAAVFAQPEFNHACDRPRVIRAYLLDLQLRSHLFLFDVLRAFSHSLDP